MTERMFKSPFFYILTGIYIIAGYQVLTFGNQAGAFFLSEDHYFENVGAFSFFIASLTVPEIANAQSGYLNRQ